MIKVKDVVYRILTKNELEMREYTPVGETETHFLFISECENVAVHK